MARDPSAVIAVSVAQPRMCNIGGRDVFTSIVRSPADHPVRFGADGPDGNATAVHTEAVLAFPAEHYDYWTAAYGVPREAWDWCHWGENLTLTGVDENTLRVGDVLDVGEEARFQVTSPRIPCFKLAWRIGQPDSCLGPMTRTGLIGFYLSVLRPGVVGAGDRVAANSPDPEAITVGDLSRLLAGEDASSPEKLRRTLENPALGAQARGMIRKRLTTIEDAKRQIAGRWAGWRAFEIAEAADEGTDIRAFRLAPVDGGPAAAFRAGQHLTVRLSEDEADGGAEIRTWSLSDYHDGPKDYRLTIRRTESGRGSGWMHAAVPGRRVLARPPAGRFVLDRSGFMRVILISAGVGVTPLLAMLKAHAERGGEAPPLLWIHAARSGGAHAHAAEADALIRKGGFERHVFYSDPRPPDCLGASHDETGRLTAERLQALVAPSYTLAPFGRSIELEGVHSDVYVCGPAAFEAMVRDALSGIGLPDGLIRSESFAPVTGERPGASLERAEVTFTASGTAAEWRADGGLTLLQLAESAGLSPAYACRQGVCGACEVDLLAGSTTYDPRPSVIAAPGRVLACCARPASAAVSLAL